MTTRQAPSLQQLNTESGASVYSPTILKLYDFGVLGLSNRFVWQCPTKTVLLPFYKEHLGLKHLDVGVGTGFYIARAGLTRSHQVSLLDLNENSLQAAAAQVKKAKVRTFMRDVMQPSSEPADTGYDSISLFYLLHCLPGTMDDKETAIVNLKRYLSKDGVLYGATILGDEAAHNAVGRVLLRLYNEKGVFHNMADTLGDLQRMLRRQFQNVQIQRHNKVALFVARN
ncbi:MAG TPA: class I SAM-dependent methyltransferase [Edaphobacter sp.]|nr:class I SAM-dependent methyltransferase [Edaphobacter sp.]